MLDPVLLQLLLGLRQERPLAEDPLALEHLEDLTSLVGGRERELRLREPVVPHLPAGQNEVVQAAFRIDDGLLPVDLLADDHVRVRVRVRPRFGRHPFFSLMACPYPCRVELCFVRGKRCP